MKINELTIYQARELLKKHELSSLNLTLSLLEQIEDLDKDLGAYITVDKDNVINQAKEADKKIAKGDRDNNFLLGIPIALKDLLCTKGLKTTCGSRILEDFVPTYDATVVLMLKNAGAVILGKTNMDEFAMGSSTENSGFHITRNPLNKKYVPGGSSGGSAAAVAAGMCIAALGSDTGGSIRQPASYCGVVGIKPTYGRVSRFGLVSYASSLDQIGPITKDVKDAAIMMNVISGHDKKDSTSANIKVPDFTSCFNIFKKNGLKGMKAGIPKEYLNLEGLDSDVKKAFLNAGKVLQDLGADIVDVSLPHLDYAVAAYYVIASSEASSNLARFDGVKYGFRDKSADNLIEMYKKTKSHGFGDEVQLRIIMGTYALSAGYYDEYYARASKVRSLIIKDFSNAFNKCDIIISPVAPTPAFKIGEKIDDPLRMYLTDVFTLSANLAGIPGMSVPCAVSSKGLPIGLQIMADRFDEENILKAGFGFEQNSDMPKNIRNNS